MNYASIKRLDIANGEGVRVSLFVSGCRNHCEGCFQPETWRFDYGQPFTEATIQTILADLAPSYVDGLTLLGGEPFEPENQRELIKLLCVVRAAYPNKDIWAFSGYTYEELCGDSHPHCEFTEEMLRLIDVLVDGRFIEAEKNLSLRFRGSNNQRIIDLKKTMVGNSVVLYCE